MIRGYFSAQTHPLLAPLQPQLRDLLREYEVAGQGKVKVEFVDPQESSESEQEAGEKIRYPTRTLPDRLPLSSRSHQFLFRYFDQVR